MEFTPISQEAAQAFTNEGLVSLRNSVRKLRTEHKISNKKLAELSGINAASLCQFMKDTDSPRPATLDVYSRLSLIIGQWRAHTNE